MPRPNKVWFRKDVGWWMVTINGKKVRLAKGASQKQAVRSFSAASLTPKTPVVCHSF
ncbi:MAG: hypothetical protein R3C28_01840 [Pirellulaceae bacterium]